LKRNADVVCVKDQQNNVARDVIVQIVLKAKDQVNQEDPTDSTLKFGTHASSQGRLQVVSDAPRCPVWTAIVVVFVITSPFVQPRGRQQKTVIVIAITCSCALHLFQVSDLVRFGFASVEGKYLALNSNKFCVPMLRLHCAQMGRMLSTVVVPPCASEMTWPQ
jgi:hypothetical protein